ncbi:hypothetical protein D3C87_1919840 [compost metagenome]
MLQQRFGLRAEHQRVIHLAVEQRLHAETVAGQKHLLPQAVPDGKREDAVQLLRAVRSPFDVGMQQHLCIAVGEEMMPPLLEFIFQLVGVI